MPGPVSTGAAKSCQLLGNDLSVGRTGHPIRADRRPTDFLALPRRLAAFCRRDAFHRQRAAIVPRAAGRVLEIGIGSGRNLPFYDPRKVAALIATGGSAGLADPTHGAIPLALHEWISDRLALATDSIDTVVVTDALHRLTDPTAALIELRRILKPGGRLVFCEPSRAPDIRVMRWQRRLTPLWRFATGGGRLDHDIPALLNRNGFVLEAIDAGYLPRRPRPLGFYCWGAATIA